MHRVIQFCIGLLTSLACAASERGAPPVQLYDLQETIGAAHVAFQVNTLADGRLVVATVGGPIFFDGVRWQVVNHPRMLGGFNAMALSADGRVYSAFNGDIGYWHEPVRGKWEWQSLAERLPPEDRATDVNRGVLLQRERNLVWYVTQSRLIRMQADHGATLVRHGQPLVGGWLVDDQVWVQDLEGRVWRANSDGPLALTEVAGALDAVGRDVNNRGYFIRRIVRGDGDWRLLLTDARILSYRDGAFVPWPHAAEQRLMRQRVTSLMRFADGRFMVTSAAASPVILARDGSELLQLDARDGVPLRTTYDAFEDAQGGVWLAQERSLLRVDLGSGFSAFGEAHGLPAGVEQLLRWKGDLYAVGGNYLYRMRPGDGQAAARFERVAGERLRAVYAVAGAGERLLVSSAGLMEWRDGIVQEVVPLAATTLISASSRVPGRFWLGHQSGLIRLEDAAEGGFRQTPMPIAWAAWHVVETADDTLWVADRAGHLARLTLGDPVAVREYGEADGLPGGVVKIFARQGGGFWLATRQGIMQLDAAADRFRSAPELPAEFRSGRVFAMLDDPQGNLWVRGDDLNAVAWRRPGGYDVDHTLLHAVSVRPTINAFLREGDTVWVARTDGLLRIDLAQRTSLPPARAPFLSEVRGVGGKKRLDLPQLASLSSDQRDLRLRFGAADLHRSDALRFSSQLAGFDPEFSPWSELAERSYTNLPPGDYRFLLQAKDGYGRVSAASPLQVRIAAPWYLTGPAIATWIACALLLLWLAAQVGGRQRQRVLIRRQRELEAEVGLRTAEIARQVEQLREQAMRLAEVDRMKTRFFVNVGHEFRTPLTLVLGPLDDLLRDTRGRLTEAVRAHLQLAQRNARRVLDLIVELLDVNRLEQGQLPLRIGVHDLAALLRRIADENAPLVERYGQSLQLDCPAAGAPARIDPAQIERCIVNLLSNAAKYSPRGSEMVLALRRDTRHWRIDVRDQGRGIAPEALPHVFDRFFQTEDSDQASGYGIGLSLVREIALAHGGDVQATSELGVGSCFSLRLPADDATTAAVSASAHESANAPASPDPSDACVACQQGRERVLVVDDHGDLRARVRELLGQRFEVIEAADGNEAWQKAQDELPDLIVSDVMMPGCDGVELTRRLRAHEDTSAIGVLLLTAKAGSEHAVAGLRAGANDYLAKPFDSSELLARCEAIVAHARRLQHRLASAAPTVAPEAIDTPDTRWRQRLDAQIAAQLHDSAFGIEELAQRMHTDRTTLFRRCKELIGMSPSDHLRETRLAHGHRLLESNAGNISEVAYASGFDSLSSFTRAFKARYGVAPSQVRARAAS